MFKQILGFAALIVSARAFNEQWGPEDFSDPDYIAINSLDYEEVQKTNPLTYAEYLEANKNYKPQSTITKPIPAPIPDFSQSNDGIWAVPPGTDFSKIDAEGVEEFHRNWLIINGV